MPRPRSSVAIPIRPMADRPALSPRLVIAGLLLSAVSLSGCGESGSEAQDVAVRFYEAVDAGHGATACGLIAPASRREIEQSTRTPCTDALLTEDIPTPGRVVETERFGNQAQVRFDHDTAFVAEFDDGWKLVAAGCTRWEPQPYDCTISGA
jgi:hypothetical protein